MKKTLIITMSLLLVLGLVFASSCGVAKEGEETPTPDVTEKEEMPTSTPTPSPTPAAMPQYTLSTSVNPSGSGTTDPASGTYDDGTEITITTAPASGYAFNHWSGDTTGTSSSVTIVMDSDKSITAHFKAHLEDGIIFQDNFDDNRNNWGGTVIDGVLYIGESAPEGSTIITTKYKFPPAAPDYPDFGYEVEITPIEADISWGRGLVFLCRRAPVSNVHLNYVFLINGNGDYKLLTTDEEYHTIIDWTVSSHINKGNASNIIKVICRDSIIELYGNGHLLESVSGEFPDDIGGNGIGLVVVASGGETIIAFDNLKMWAITPS